MRPPSLNLARLLGRLGYFVCHSFDAKTYAKLIVQFVVPVRSAPRARLLQWSLPQLSQVHLFLVPPLGSLSLSARLHLP